MFRKSVKAIKISDKVSEILNRTYNTIYRFFNMYIEKPIPRDNIPPWQLQQLFNDTIVDASEAFFQQHVSSITEYHTYISAFGYAQSDNRLSEYLLSYMIQTDISDSNMNKPVRAPSLQYNLLCTVYFNRLCRKKPLYNTVFSRANIKYILTFIFKSLKDKHEVIQRRKSAAEQNALTYYGNENLNPGKLLQALCDIVRNSPPNISPHSFSLLLDIIVLSNILKQQASSVTTPRTRTLSRKDSVTSDTMFDYTKNMLRELWSNDDFSKLSVDDLVELRAAFQGDTYLYELFDHIITCVTVSDGAIGEDKMKKCKGDNPFDAPRRTAPLDAPQEAPRKVQRR